ncbi:TPA_inf: hypothetical protein gp_01 [Marinomonas phage YY]|nr:TPA_inf: hypothetical protein gp_01 [Marinomonas phage YY]
MNILNILAPITDIFRAKLDLKKTRIEAEAKAMITAAESGATWEANAAQNAANSWADEYWTAVLSVPLIAAFVPPLVPFVHDGFAALQAVPEWYKWAVGASISFAFARRGLPAFFTKAR